MYNIDLFACYEHIVRELDSIILLKLYLQKENYKTIISDITFSRRLGQLRYLPKVVAIPFCHSIVDKNLIPFDEMYNYSPKLINLHWEQIGSINSKSFFAPKDEFARNLFHVSWSKDFTDFLINEGKIKKDLIWETGNPKADLLTSRFSKIYTSKKVFYDKIQIPQNARYYVFIMSFASAFVDKRYIYNVESKGGFKNYKQFTEITRKSLISCIKTTKQLAKLCKDSNIYLILRPHPMTPIKKIHEMVRDVDNIRVSRDLPLHEVIYYSSGVISWLSTGTLDAYVMQRPTVVLRPINIPEEYDIDLLRGFQKVDNAVDLLSCIQEQNIINKKILEGYKNILYGNLDGNNTLRLAKKIIHLLKNEDLLLSKNRQKQWFTEVGRYLLKDIPKNVISKLVPSMLPQNLYGRTDDMYSKRIENELTKKYTPIINTDS